MSQNPKTLKVLNRTGGVVGAVITVEALEDSTVVYDSFLGEREFFLWKGHRLTLRVRRHSTFEGDTLSMNRLVGIAIDWAKIPWRWAY